MSKISLMANVVVIVLESTALYFDCAVPSMAMGILVFTITAADGSVAM